MLTSFRHNYIQVKFINFDTLTMIGVGTMLKTVVGRFVWPQPWTDAWVPFSDTIDEMVIRNGDAAVLPPDTPEARQALADLKGEARALGGIIDGQVNSSVLVRREAAAILKSQLMPKGLEPITETDEEVVGWATVALYQLNGPFQTYRDLVGASLVVDSMGDAHGRYLKLKTQIAPMSDGPTMRKLLDASRGYLRWALVDMESMLRRHPELLEQVKEVLQPLDDLMDKVRAEQRAAARDADNDDGTSSDDGDDDDTANDDGASNVTDDDDDVETDEDEDDDVEDVA